MERKSKSTFEKEIKLKIIFDEKAPENPMLTKEDAKPKKKINKTCNNTSKEDKKIWKKINKLYDQKIGNINFEENISEKKEIWESDSEEIQKIIDEEKIRAKNINKVLNKLYKRVNNKKSDTSDSD